MARLPRLLMLALAACGTASAAKNAAETTLVYPCLPATRPIQIDGRLDPQEWAGAVKVSGFTISGSDKLAPEQVTMRLLHDRERLYLGVTCYESNMAKLKTAARVTDGPFWLDDSIEFFIDANHDHETYWQFAATAKAVRYDNQQGDSSWNSAWQTAAQRGANAWSIEAAVPFADLKQKAPTPGTIWGFNLCRERQAGGSLELYNWADVQRVFKNADLFGHLYFVPTEWESTEAGVRPAREAGGKVTRVFVNNGYWRLSPAAKPALVTYREALRRQKQTAAKFLNDLARIYQERPRLAYRKEFDKLNAAYLRTQDLIEADTAIDAEQWAGARAFLSALPDKSESLYWRVRLAELNEEL